MINIPDIVTGLITAAIGGAAVWIRNWHKKRKNKLKASKIYNESKQDRIIDVGNLNIIYFKRPSYEPCEANQHTIDVVKKKYPEQLNVTIVDVNSQRIFADFYNVKSIPTILIVKQGEIKNRITKNISEKALDSKIKKLLEN